MREYMRGCQQDEPPRTSSEGHEAEGEDEEAKLEERILGMSIFPSRTVNFILPHPC